MFLGALIGYSKGKRQWKGKEIESISEYWSETIRRSPGKRELLHLFFRKNFVPFIWFLPRFFAWFGDGRTWTRRFRLPCTFPPLRFICWTIDGIGALYVFTYIFFARTLSLARINVVTMLRSKSERAILFYFPFRWHSLLINTPGDYVNKDEKAEVACDPPPDQRLSRVDPVCF